MRAPLVATDAAKRERRRRVGQHIPTSEGRQLLLRPAAEGDGVQLAIVGKRGSLVEAVGIGLDQATNFLLAFDGMTEIAWGMHQRSERRAKRTRERRHGEALRRNPWLRRPPKHLVHANYNGRSQ